MYVMYMYIVVQYNDLLDKIFTFNFLEMYINEQVRIHSFLSL